MRHVEAHSCATALSTLGTLHPSSVINPRLPNSYQANAYYTNQRSFMVTHSPHGSGHVQLKSCSR